MKRPLFLKFLFLPHNIFSICIIYLSIIFCFLALQACSKQLENKGLPSVDDWSDGFLRVTGYGNLDPDLDLGQRRFYALQEAREDAFFQLQREVYALPVDTKNRIGDLVRYDEELHLKVDRFIYSARMVDSRVDKKKGIEIDMELYLGASLRSFLGLVEKPRSSNKNHQSPSRSEF